MSSDLSIKLYHLVRASLHSTFDRKPVLMIPPSQQLEELILIRSSLLPGERLIFLNSTSSCSPDNTTMTWERLVDEGIVTDTEAELENLPPAGFRVGVDGVNVSFEIDCQGYDGDCTNINNCISISGPHMSRAVQEGWRKVVIELLEGVAEAGGDFPLYQLLSLHLLPLLHEEEINPGATCTAISGKQKIQTPPSTAYHVLFTSHHLISTTKRRNLSGWCSKLRISGFAKIGYPGVIYAEGSKESIEEFADNIKGMQWLALKKRFVEPLEGIVRDNDYHLSGWKEFEKVGEVVEEMRRLGRGEYVLEMGIGAGAKELLTPG